MEQNIYYYTLFVFGLSCALFLLAYVLMKRYRKADDDGKDERLFKMYQSLEDMIDELEEFVKKSKIEIERQISPVKSELEALLQKNQRAMEMRERYDDVYTANTETYGEYVMPELKDEVVITGQARKYKTDYTTDLANARRTTKSETKSKSPQNRNHQAPPHVSEQQTALAEEQAEVGDFFDNVDDYIAEEQAGGVNADVRRMLKKGMTVDAIAKQLGIGKVEVELIEMLSGEK